MTGGEKVLAVSGIMLVVGAGIAVVVVMSAQKPATAPVQTGTLKGITDAFTALTGVFKTPTAGTSTVAKTSGGFTGSEHGDTIPATWQTKDADDDYDGVSADEDWF